MTRRGWALFAVMSVVWGVPYLLIKVAGEEVAPPVVVFARTALGALLLLVPALRAGGFGALRGHWPAVLAFAACEVIGPWWLLSDAERRLPSSLTGLLVAAVPIVGIGLAYLAGGRERLGPVRWAGLALGLAGVFLLAGRQVAGGDLWSITEVFLTVLGYAFAPMIAARRLADVPSLPMTAACLSVAALCYLPLAVLSRPSRMPDGGALAALGTLGVVCTALAFLAFFALIREAGTARAMVFTYVAPVVAVLAGVLFLGEPLTGTVIASSVLVVAGCVLATGRGGGTGGGGTRTGRGARGSTAVAGAPVAGA
ncbi:DMT family transporter, partial [Streptomyces fuscigenes]|uniref:DMT family transporter n=1 Tax=Streptomyces fuscigenes TaxID=1528880 RepID=UPI001F187C0E